MLYRHPTVRSDMAATEDITSNWRLELGLGDGWDEQVTTAERLALGTITLLFGRFEEGLGVVPGLLTNDRTKCEGRYCQLNEPMSNPKGSRNPVPICVGGSGNHAAEQ